jgi:hypothetical protein
MENDNSFIMSKTGSGNNLRLIADHANGGQIVMHSPVAMPGTVGKITGVSIGTSGYTVTNNYCRETSVVILTAVNSDNDTGDVPDKYWVYPSSNYFKVFDGGFTAAWSFNYVIINP